jgi:hypothetical protein
MKQRILLFIVLLIAGFQAICQPVITFDDNTRHLGFVRQGDTLHFQYKFANTGNQPVLISDTKVECGCTVVDKPTEPIFPGKQGAINVTFHTNSAIDRQERTVTVISNAKNSPVQLRFKCVVLKAKKP